MAYCTGLENLQRLVAVHPFKSDTLRLPSVSYHKLYTGRIWLIRSELFSAKSKPIKRTLTTWEVHNYGRWTSLYLCGWLVQTTIVQYVCYSLLLNYHTVI